MKYGKFAVTFFLIICEIPKVIGRVDTISKRKIGHGLKSRLYLLRKQGESGANFLSKCSKFIKRHVPFLKLGAGHFNNLLN